MCVPNCSKIGLKDTRVPNEFCLKGQNNVCVVLWFFGVFFGKKFKIIFVKATNRHLFSTRKRKKKSDQVIYTRSVDRICEEAKRYIM